MMKLNAFQLKLAALVAMTLDHVAVYLVDFPGLRIIGRIAAVLFLYALVESLRHTKSKPAFLLRLYCAHALLLPATLLVDWVLHWYRPLAPYLGIPRIFGTLFLTALFIVLVETFISACRNRNGKAIVQYSVIMVLVIALPILLLFQINHFQPLLHMLEYFHLDNTVAAVRLFTGLIHLVPNVVSMEYSMLFILMGLCWYFFPQKSHQLLVLALASCISYGGSHWIDPSRLWPLTEFFDYEQFWMILAAPFIALYNGLRGPSLKYAFYLYYPLHIYVLFLIGINL